MGSNYQVSSKSVNQKWVNGRGHRTTTDKQTNRQTDRHTRKVIIRVALSSAERANQHTCDICSKECIYTLHAGDVSYLLLKCKTVKLTTRRIANVCAVNNHVRSTVRQIWGALLVNIHCRPLAQCQMPCLMTMMMNEKKHSQNKE